jgi:hypothetical protein
VCHLFPRFFEVLCLVVARFFLVFVGRERGGNI